jgi:hypothetical protein
VGNEGSDLVCGKLNRVFVVHAPVNPLFIVEIGEQSYYAFSDCVWRSDVFAIFRSRSTKTLVRDPKRERMVRPELAILQHHVLGNGAVPIAGQNDRFH